MRNNLENKREKKYASLCFAKFNIFTVIYMHNMQLSV